MNFKKNTSLFSKASSVLAFLTDTLPATNLMPNSPRVLVLGAHPDDADIKAGGTSALWIAHGFEVLFVSVTDGGAGHQTMPRQQLVERRRAEAKVAGEVIG